jgi:hypothetical protein
MKAIARFLVALFLVLVNWPGHRVYAQTDSCGFTGPQQGALTQEGGYQITSMGTVKVLLVFIDFPDDAEDPNNPVWPPSPAPRLSHSPLAI